MKEVVIATRNQDKFSEMKAIFELLDETDLYSLLSLSAFLELPSDFDVVEDGSSFEENALLKARGYGEKIHQFVIADDSGLEVDAFGGRPGIYSARYGPSDWNEKKLSLLSEFEGVPDEKRTARLVCVMAVYNPEGMKVS